MRRSEAHHVPARVLHEIYKFCPNFQLKYPDARTWKDIKYCSGAFTINGVFSLDWLKAQYLYARINLGLPFGEVLTRAWNTDHLKDIRARVRSGNVELLENAYDLQLPFKYCILVRALPKPSPIGAIATMAGENIMTFYPIFFEGYDGMLEDSLRDFLIIPFETDIRGFTGGRVQIVLHELFHSPSVLNGESRLYKFASHC